LAASPSSSSAVAVADAIQLLLRRPVRVSVTRISPMLFGVSVSSAPAATEPRSTWSPAGTDGAVSARPPDVVIVRDTGVSMAEAGDRASVPPVRASPAAAAANVRRRFMVRFPIFGGRSCNPSTSSGTDSMANRSHFVITLRD
jgi:hypothetical protein